MKKLITLIGSILLISSSGIIVISCKTQQKSNNQSLNFNNEKTFNQDIKTKNDTNNEKSDQNTSKEIDKEKTENKNQNLTIKKEEKKIKDEQVEKKQKYILQRSKENNFSLTKEYGLKHADFTWNNQDKWSKWKSDSKNSWLASLIGQVTTFYSKISKYASVVELEKEFENKLNQNRNYKSFEEFIEKMDMTITKYLEQKDSIWKQLQEISKT
ncbi:lipoprotein [Mycoplasma mycoides]|uniref:lipoprotein n=1 Tax=Mycoplasma mycoides TaxID=2102 RepID=UPI00223EB519|nr:lipoprotein [Mycoplasma mycoides]QVJ95738.1 lipoprotein [Mycoplasma mycoides subsp. capri]